MLQRRRKSHSFCSFCCCINNQIQVLIFSSEAPPPPPGLFSLHLLPPRCPRLILHMRVCMCGLSSSNLLRLPGYLTGSPTGIDNNHDDDTANAMRGRRRRRRVDVPGGRRRVRTIAYRVFVASGSALQQCYFPFFFPTIERRLPCRAAALPSGAILVRWHHVTTTTTTTSLHEYLDKESAPPSAPHHATNAHHQHMTRCFMKLPLIGYSRCTLHRAAR